MNREQRKRITQNITNLKERLVDLDPIIDRLIEKDVFTLEHRERIEHVSPATPQKKFNEFIQLLLSSPEPNTYFVFLEALTEERHHYMAERLQNTVISGTSPVRNSSYNRDRSRSRVTSAMSRRSYDHSGASGPAGFNYGGAAALEQVMSRLLSDFGGKINSNISNSIQKMRAEDKQEMEKRMDEKLAAFKKEWEDEKTTMLKMNESAIRNLQTSVEKLRRSNEEYNRLSEKYEKLKEMQKEMREKENERWQRLSQSNAEKAQLKITNEDLKSQIQNLQERVTSLEGENSRLKEKDCQNQIDLEHLAIENKTLIQELDEKDKERLSLKKEVEMAYSRISDVVKFQREKSELEDVTYKSALEKQSEKLNEIFEVVNSMNAKDRPRISSRSLYIGGSGLKTPNKPEKK
ncbi:golgin subfamily A member 6-like protein 22 [Saccostrea echinata]|uniref:golgin subfamily A member 6-like protein 22 n=1 Tax=Saccostrea echinata TaxID=191078 RepID=UPI002A7F5CD0|nr:golgin subfamily A member 6-like protein 22 [Saccostrea echinata]